MPRSHHAATLLLLLLTGLPLAAGDGVFDQALYTVELNQTRTVNASIQNPFPVDQRVAVTFSGGIMAESLVDLTFPGGPCPGGIVGGEQVCELSVPAEDSRSLIIDMAAERVDQDTLVASTNLTQTQGSDADSTIIRVEGRYPGPQFSGPGIQLLQLLVIGLIAGVSIAFRR